MNLEEAKREKERLMLSGKWGEPYTIDQHMIDNIIYTDYCDKIEEEIKGKYFYNPLTQKYFYVTWVYAMWDDQKDGYLTVVIGGTLLGKPEREYIDLPSRSSDHLKKFYNQGWKTISEFKWKEEESRYDLR